MYTCKILCVTNRGLAGEDFLGQLGRIADAGVDGIILREKDLPLPEYRNLTAQALKICASRNVPLIPHTYPEAAEGAGIRSIHLPGPVFFAMDEQKKRRFDRIGVSVHSREEALRAWENGASYVTAGHVFLTDCKKGVPARGISFLEEVCKAVPIPVYAIGGIDAGNAPECIRAGAAGICLMSSLMKAGDPAEYVRELRQKISSGG